MCMRCNMPFTADTAFRSPVSQTCCEASAYSTQSCNSTSCLLANCSSVCNTTLNIERARTRAKSLISSESIAYDRAHSPSHVCHTPIFKHRLSEPSKVHECCETHQSVSTSYDLSQFARLAGKESCPSALLGTKFSDCKQVLKNVQFNSIYHQFYQMSSPSSNLLCVDQKPLCCQPSAGTSHLISYNQRLVRKSGQVNIKYIRSGHMLFSKYLSDVVTTLVDSRWRWMLLVFALSFILSWLFFAIIWWFLLKMHTHFDSSNAKACVINVNDLSSAFLFSIETQHTIGYGFRYVSDHCTDAIILVCLQSIVGLLIQAVMVSVVFAKLARPTKRACTLIFSRNAVICQRDGQLCLMFRIGNLQSSSLVDAHVSAYLVYTHTTAEGECLPLQLLSLSLITSASSDREVSGAADSVLFMWPSTVVHHIDASSPFYRMSRETLRSQNFEIVVAFEGTSESTAVMAQARTSYTASEVLWGYRFVSNVVASPGNLHYTVDYSLFDCIEAVEMPNVSAADLSLEARKCT